MDKEALIRLHSILSEFETLLARRYVPANWDAEGIEEIRFLQEIIEDLAR